jgi:nucleoside-diphosphate-sugar epimerase
MTNSIRGHIQAKGVLITGFPSLLAGALTRCVLQDDNSPNVYLFLEKGHKALGQAFKNDLHRTVRKRLILLEGRQDTVELGLSGAQVHALTENIDMIFHGNNLQPFGRRANRKLDNLRHLIRIALACKSLRRFCLFSNTSVNRHPTQTIYEEDLTEPTLDGTPSDTLRRTEQVVRELMPRLPCTIFRPSTIVGNSQTGDSEGLRDGLGRVLANLIHSPSQMPVLVPRARDMPFNVVPIDFVVTAAWAIACSPASMGRTFHLTDPNPMRVEDAFALFSDLNNRQRPLFYGRVFAHAIGALRKSVFKRLVPDFLIEEARGVIASSYDCTGTLDILQSTEIRCPQFESYADNLATWLAKVERESMRNHR